MSGTEAFLVLGIVALPLGLRGSIRLTRRYRDVRGQLDSRERLILLTFVVLAWAALAIGIYLVVLAGRRVLDMAPLEWTPVVTLVIAAGILYLPAVLDFVIERVARVPWRP